MRVFSFVIIATMLVATGCLVRPTSSSKKLHRVHSHELTPKQLQHNRKNAVEAAEDMMYEACKSLLYKGKWYETENGDGLFVYQIKRKKIISDSVRCQYQQYMTLNLQAVYQLVRYGHSCSLSKDRWLRLNMPSPDGKNNIIKVTCDTRLIDLHATNDGMRIISYTDTGRTHTAIVNQAGYLQHDVHNVIVGVSNQRAAQLHSKITEAKMTELVAKKPTPLIISDSNTTITGALASLIASEAITAEPLGTRSIELINTSNQARLFVPTTATLILALRTFLWSQPRKWRDDYVPTVAVMRALLDAHLKVNATQPQQGDR